MVTGCQTILSSFLTRVRASRREWSSGGGFFVVFHTGTALSEQVLTPFTGDGIRYHLKCVVVVLVLTDN